LVHCVPNDHFSRAFFLVHCLAFPRIVPHAIGLAPIRQFFYHRLFSLDYHFLYQTKDKKASTARTHHPHKQIGGVGGCLICSHSPSQNLGPSILYLFLPLVCVFIDDWQGD
jgi:hypothetical protein